MCLIGFFILHQPSDPLPTSQRGIPSESIRCLKIAINYFLRCSRVHSCPMQGSSAADRKHSTDPSPASAGSAGAGTCFQHCNSYANHVFAVHRPMSVLCLAHPVISEKCMPLANCKLALSLHLKYCLRHSAGHVVGCRSSLCCSTSDGRRGQLQGSASAA